MHRTVFTSAFLALLSAGASFAQAPATESSASTAPVVSAPAPANEASSTVVSPQPPVVVQAPAPAPAGYASAVTAPSVTQIVYTPQLPNAADLTNAAAAQGYTVDRIIQTGTQVIAFYRTANGQPTTVAYQTLPPSGNAPAQTVAAPTPAPLVVNMAPPPTVVYQTAPRVIYYESPAYYYPRVWYPPVSLNIGLGYRSVHGGHWGGPRHRF